jgi:hypothetical protein
MTPYERKLRRTLIGVGSVAAILNAVFALIAAWGHSDRMIAAPLMAMPTLWAVGALWLAPPKPSAEKPDRAIEFVTAAIPVSILTSAILSVVFATGVVIRVTKHPGNWARIESILMPISLMWVFSGVACGVYLLVVAARWLWRAAKGGMTDGEDDTSAEGRP